MNDEKYEIFVVSDEKSLKFFQSDKPIFFLGLCIKLMKKWKGKQYDW